MFSSLFLYYLGNKICFLCLSVFLRVSQDWISMQFICKYKTIKDQQRDISVPRFRSSFEIHSHSNHSQSFTHLHSIFWCVRKELQGSPKPIVCCRTAPPTKPIYCQEVDPINISVSFSFHLRRRPLLHIPSPATPRKGTTIIRTICDWNKFATQ